MIKTKVSSDVVLGCTWTHLYIFTSVIVFIYLTNQFNFANIAACRNVLLTYSIINCYTFHEKVTQGTSRYNQCCTVQYTEALYKQSKIQTLYFRILVWPIYEYSYAFPKLNTSFAVQKLLVLELLLDVASVISFGAEVCGGYHSKRQPIYM